MMDFLKDLKWTSIAYSIILTIFGFLFLIFPGTMSNAICMITGIGLTVIGVVVLVTYMTKKVELVINGNGLVTGVVIVACGVFVMTKPEFVISIIPFILGLTVIISGIKKLQNYIDIRRMHYNEGIAVLVLAIITTIFGIILMINPFSSALIMLRVMGVGFIISGISDIYSILYMQRRFKQFMDSNSPIDSTAVEVDSDN